MFGNQQNGSYYEVPSRLPRLSKSCLLGRARQNVSCPLGSARLIESCSIGRARQNMRRLFGQACLIVSCTIGRARQNVEVHFRRPRLTGSCPLGRARLFGNHHNGSYCEVPSRQCSTVRQPAKWLLTLRCSLGRARLLLFYVVVYIDTLPWSMLSYVISPVMCVPFSSHRIMCAFVE